MYIHFSFTKLRILQKQFFIIYIFFYNFHVSGLDHPNFPQACIFSFSFLFIFRICFVSPLHVIEDEALGWYYMAYQFNCFNSIRLGSKDSKGDRKYFFFPHKKSNYKVSQCQNLLMESTKKY